MFNALELDCFIDFVDLSIDRLIVLEYSDSWSSISWTWLFWLHDV